MGFLCFLCFSGPVGVLAGRDDGRVFLFLSFFPCFFCPRHSCNAVIGRNGLKEGTYSYTIILT